MPKNASALEIHFINVSQGDSILIINRDLAKLEKAVTSKKFTKPTDSLDWLPCAIKNDVDLKGTVKYALLIDGGEDYYGGDVFLYLQQYGVTGEATRKVFATVVSHYHSDHVDGLRCVYKKKKAGQKTPVNNYPPAIAYDMGDDPKLDPDTITYSAYVGDIKDFVSTKKIGTQRTKLTPGSVIEMGEDGNNVEINLRCLAANGIVSQGQKKAKKDIIDRTQKIDQNDRSVVLVLEYGEFRCLFGGDAGGTGNDTGGNFDTNQDQRTKQFFSSHGDLETSLRRAVTETYPADSKRSNTADGHICCFKSHHHGSASSNDVFLLGAMQPRLVLCSSGSRIKFHGHPTQEALDRMDIAGKTGSKWPTPSSKKKLVQDITIENYYITEMVVNGKYGWGGKTNQTFKRTITNGKILGDFIVRPFNDVTVTKPKGANTISIQVYGSGAQAAMDGEKTLRAVDNTKTGIGDYPLGPWEHTCSKH